MHGHENSDYIFRVGKEHQQSNVTTTYGGNTVQKGKKRNIRIGTKKNREYIGKRVWVGVLRRKEGRNETDCPINYF